MPKISKIDTRKLINKGKKQGYITQDEILELFPHAELYLTGLDELYQKLFELGVDVFESVTEKQLVEDEAKINGELLGAQGKPVDLGGYYQPDLEKATRAMRPSPTLNAIVDAIACRPQTVQK